MTSRKLLLLLFSFSLLTKLYIISHTVGPHVFGDALKYKQMAEAIFHHLPIPDAHYPPLYPLALSFSFFFHESWYETMLIINSLVSSVAVIPVYLISRKITSPSTALLAALVTCFLPYHAIYPSLILAENLSTPLFLFAVYYTLFSDPKHKSSGYLVGLSLSLLYLTKFLFLPSTIILSFLWAWRIRFKPSALLKPLMVGMILVGIWLLYADSAGFSLYQALGFSTIERIAHSSSLRDKFNWLMFYSSYLILALGAAIPATLTLSRRTKSSLFIFTLATLSLASVLLSARYSWGASYNHPIPNYILGRYLLHLTPLYLIGGLTAYSSKRKLSWYSAGIIGIFSLAMVTMAQKILFGNLLTETTAWFAGIPFNALDVFVYLNSPYILVFFIIIGFSSLFLSFNTKRRLTLVFVGWLIFYGLVYKSALTRVLDTNDRDWPRHARTIASQLDPQDTTQLTIYEEKPNLANLSILPSLEFWGIRRPTQIITSLPDTITGLVDTAIVVTDTRYGDEYQTMYQVGGDTYYLYFK